MRKHNFLHYILTVIFFVFRSFIFVIAWALIALAGLSIFQSKVSPYNVILGLPLLLGGIGLGLNALWTLLIVFSPRYNRGVCIICKKDVGEE